MSPGFTVMSLIVALLGGGIVSALINWMRANNSENRQQKTQFLNTQIQLLYGPLYYLTSQTKAIYKLCDEILEGGVDLYESLESSKNSSLPKKMTDVTMIYLRYFELYEKLNDEIKNILDRNNSHGDPDDNEVFIKFSLNYLRTKEEITLLIKHPIPKEIYDNIGKTLEIDSEFIKTIKTKYYQKKEELLILTRGKMTGRSNSFRIFRQIIYLLIAASIGFVGKWGHTKYEEHIQLEHYNRTLSQSISDIENEINANLNGLESDLVNLKNIQDRKSFLILNAIYCTEWDINRHVIEDSRSNLSEGVISEIKTIYRLFHKCDYVGQLYKSFYVSDNMLLSSFTLTNIERIYNDIKARHKSVSQDLSRRKKKLNPQ